MSDVLAELGIGIAHEGDGVVVRGGDMEWLRLVLVAFGHRAAIERNELTVATRDVDRVRRAVVAAVAPEAVLFDLDGVLADLQGRALLVDVDEVRLLAAERPLGVVTTCPRRLAASVLDRYGLAASFGVVICSEDGPCKPDPFPVLLALQRLGVETAWMLGDNPSDVRAARGGGAVPFAVQPRGIGAESHADRLRAAGAVRLVDGVAEFGSLLPSG